MRSEETFQDLVEYFEPEHIHCVTPYKKIETHSHWLESISTKTICKAVLHIINDFTSEHRG